MIENDFLSTNSKVRKMNRLTVRRVKEKLDRWIDRQTVRQAHQLWTKKMMGRQIGKYINRWIDRQ